MNDTVWVAVVVFPFAGMLAWWSMRDWKRSARRVRREDAQAFQTATRGWGEVREDEFRLALRLAAKRGDMTAQVMLVDCAMRDFAVAFVKPLEPFVAKVARLNEGFAKAAR